MALDYNTGSVLLSGLQYRCVLQMQACPEPVEFFLYLDTFIMAGTECSYLTVGAGRGAVGATCPGWKLHHGTT